MTKTKATKLKTKNELLEATVAKALAPDDIRTGDYVAVLHEYVELPSFLWSADAATVPLDEPVRMQFVPVRDSVPLQVKSVCLPFVLVRRPGGRRQILDVRRCRLARLNRQFARATWKTLKKSRKH